MENQRGSRYTTKKKGASISRIEVTLSAMVMQTVWGLTRGLSSNSISYNEQGLKNIVTYFYFKNRRNLWHFRIIDLLRGFLFL
jgi:hypothetical protein